MKYVSLGVGCAMMFHIKRLGLPSGRYPFNWTTTSREHLLQMLRTDFDAFYPHNTVFTCLKTGFFLTHPPEPAKSVVIADFRERVAEFRKLREERGLVFMRWLVPDRLPDSYEDLSEALREYGFKDFRLEFLAPKIQISRDIETWWQGDHAEWDSLINEIRGRADGGRTADGGGAGPAEAGGGAG